MCYFMCIGIGVTKDIKVRLKLSGSFELSWSSMDVVDLQHGVDHLDGYGDSSRWMKHNKNDELDILFLDFVTVLELCNILPKKSKRGDCKSLILVFAFSCSKLSLFYLIFLFFLCNIGYC